MPNKSKSVSVVIPIYGSFDERRAVMSVDSILNQKGVDLEVIVSEQGVEQKFPFIDDDRVKHVFNQHIPQENLSDFNPGRVRNQATQEATGEFLYTNDADVIFLNDYFLKEGIGRISEDPLLSLRRPPMRRLPLDNFEDFFKAYKRQGIPETVGQLNFSQEFFATLDGQVRELKVVKKDSEGYEKTFVAYIEDFKRYVADKSLKGQEPTIWTENRHCGGNLTRRSQFEAVGRYSEAFINWGCEDSDLQWKLGEAYKMTMFPYEKDFEVLHLDHPKGYFSSEMWKRNEVICSGRKMKGVDYAIQEDKDE